MSVVGWKPPSPWIKANPKDQPGEGGQSYIFQVVAPERAGLYALKRLKNKKRRPRFVREVEAMDQLSGLGFKVPPVIAKYLDGEDPSFVMPWYPGGSLEAIIDRGKEDRPTLEELLDILISVGVALRQIHSAKMAHRDVKPANILRDNGSVLLADFGLCLGVEDERLTQPWEVIGPRNYVAPENEDGINDDVDQRPADCYAYAKLCWSLLSGRQALPRERQLEPLNRIEVVAGEAALSPLSSLFEVLLDRDPRTRMSDWDVVLSEVSRVRDRVVGAANGLSRTHKFDLEGAIARASQLAANEAMINERLQWKKEQERDGVEKTLRRLMFLDFKSELEEAAGRVNLAANGSIRVDLFSGRPIGDQTTQE